ncbi:HWE histidine kinase domain-containing protein [Falsiroseomonas tokyonensis]|uniref:histidine kinase n=1 Tax=Falsiroseomonas tokyonensis TaxID=430521 RepID=A0ABV7BM32_9PROT|nr:HWE histidine kinase domain-containing protein [Falsiroseomonas tokyonensis]MBU8536634.1 PAS domain-containing protein [Falsiroseomonas tokyonensis]
MADTLSEHVGPLLILAPSGRDAVTAAALLRRDGIDCRAVPDIAGLRRAMDETAGAVLVADEALSHPALEALGADLAAQPPWSDLPFIVLTRGGIAGRTAIAALRLPERLGNAVFIERPLNALSLVGAVRSALRARLRQRQLRTHLLGREADAAAARASEAHWRGLFERMHEGFALCEVVRDAEGRAWDYRLVELNPAFERLTGISRAKALGKTARAVLPGVEPPWLAICAGVVESGQPARVLDHATRPGRWFELHVYRPEPGRFALLVMDVTERRQTEERQILLTREVDHRAKNVLAVVQAALRLTPRHDPGAYVKAIEGRIAALARAHTLLAAEHWSGADLRALLRHELAAFLEEPGAAPRVKLEGQDLMLPPTQAQPLAMALHELTTNAAKYGALSRPGGRLTIRWQLEPGPRLHLCWMETGGPPVTGPPRRNGFGSRVLAGTLRGQLQGQVALDWQPGGLVCEMQVPLDDQAQPPD